MILSVKILGISLSGIIFALCEDCERIQKMQRLDCEEFNRALEHNNIIGDYDLIQGQVVFNLPLIISVENNPAPVGVEGRQQTVLGQMNRQLDQLPMHLLDCLMIAVVKEWLQGIRNVIVVHVHRPVVIIVDFSEVYCVFVVDIFKDVDLLLKDCELFLVFIKDSLLYEDLFWFALRFVELAKGKLACFHVN